MDEGMLRCGLQAAAQRLPFLPIRAGLGSDVRAFWGDELKTVTSPYPTGAGYEELVAMPALTLDAAFVHLNLGDAQGNAAYTGIDPYFDDLFLMAAQRRFLSVEKVVLHRGTGEIGSAAGTAGQPDDGRQRGRGARSAPTSPPPSPITAATRSSSATTPRPPAPTRRWAEFVSDLPVRQRGRLPGRGAQVRRERLRRRRSPSDFRDPGRGVRRRLRRTVPRRRRDHGQPDDDDRVDRRPAGPADVLPRHRADRRRGPADRRHPRHRRRRRDRGLDAVRPRLRDAGLGPAPCRDGRQPDRPLRQPEPVGVRARCSTRPARCSGCAARRATPSTTPPATWSATTPRGCSASRSTSCPESAGTRSIPTTRPTGSSTSTAWCPTSACSTSTAPTIRCGRCRCTRASRPTRSPRTRRSRCTGSTRPRPPGCRPRRSRMLIREVIDPKVAAGQEKSSR